MNKRIATLALAIAFTAVTVGAAYSFTCKVTAVEGTKVTVDCKKKYAKKLSEGVKVKLSIKKARKAVEGC